MWSRACVPVTRIMSVSSLRSNMIPILPDDHACFTFIACPQIVAPLAPLNSNWPHEAHDVRRTKGSWLPFALVMSLCHSLRTFAQTALLRETLSIVTASGVRRLPLLTFFRNTSSGPCLCQEGQPLAQPQPRTTAWIHPSLLSIDYAWAHGCSL